MYWRSLTKCSALIASQPGRGLSRQEPFYCETTRRARLECAAPHIVPMTTELLPSIDLETAPNPGASVIWLHGLGADGNDFVPIVPELDIPTSKPVRFIFPHAPV